MWKSLPVRVQISRDSVAAGDDLEPHDQEIEVDERCTLTDFFKMLAAGGYLPEIWGGQATWAATAGRDGKLLAIVAAQWKEPELFVDAAAGIETLGADIHFRYLAQRDPRKVVGLVRAARDAAELAIALDPYGPV